MSRCLVCNSGFTSTRDVLLRASDEDDTKISVCSNCPQSQIYDRLRNIAASKRGIRFRSPRRSSDICTHWVSAVETYSDDTPLPSIRVIHGTVTGYTDIAKLMASASIHKAKTPEDFYDLRRWIINGLDSVGLSGFKIHKLAKTCVNDYVMKVISTSKLVNDVTLKIQDVDNIPMVAISYMYKGSKRHIYLGLSDTDLTTRRMHDDWIVIANNIISISINVPAVVTVKDGRMLGADDSATIDVSSCVCECCMERVYHMFGSSLDSQACMHGYFGVDPIIQGYTNCIATSRELSHSPHRFLDGCTTLCINPPNTVEESRLITNTLLAYCAVSHITTVIVFNDYTPMWLLEYFDSRAI